jgi:hypothetical protein
MGRLNLRNTAFRLKWLIAGIFLLPLLGYGAINTFDLLRANRLDVDNVRVDGNTISTTNTNGDLTVDLNGSGSVIFTDLTASTILGLDSSKKATSITIPLSVANGGTGLSSGTSGGILGFTASGTLASSGALTANQLVIGGGAGATPSSLAAGSQYQVLVMGAANPGYGQVDLGQSAAITGTLPVGNGGTGQTTKAAAFDALSPTTSVGDIIYHNGTNNVRLAGNTSGSRKFLASTGLGGFATDPFWTQPAAGDLTGTIPIATGGTNNGSLGVTAGGVIYADGSKLMNTGAGSAGQVLLSDGSGAPVWGTAGAGGTNEQREYIGNGKAESSTSGWATYDDGAADPVDGTGGAFDSGFARTTTANEIIRETASFRLTKSAANRQGEGVSYDFTVDPHDYANGQPVYITFDYKTVSSYVAGDVKVFVYDKDAAALLTVFDSSQLNGALPPSTGGTRFTGRFYPSTSTSDDYRLIFHITSTNASGWDFIFDSVHVGTANLIPGFISSKSTSYTPTLTTSGGGSITLNSTAKQDPSGSWQRIGNRIRVFFNVRNGTGGAASGSAGTVRFGLPSGIVLDTTNIVPTTGTAYTLDGAVQLYTASGFITTDAYIISASDGYIVFTKPSSGSYLAVSDLAAAASIAGWVEFPVSGWTDSLTLSTSEAMFVGQSWSGYHNASDCSMARTNTAYGDQTADASCTFTERTNKNMGTVASALSGSDKLPGVTFTPGRVGVYEICAGVMYYGPASSVATNGIQMIDGSSNVLAAEISQTTGTAQEIKNMMLCGHLNVTGSTVGTSNTVKLQGKSTTGAITITGIDWTIKNIPDLSIFSVYGPFELLTATSSTKTPSATNNYHQLTGNLLALPKGTWRLFGSSLFGNSGSTPTYATRQLSWTAANGADSSSVPAALSTVSGLSILSVNAASPASSTPATYNEEAGSQNNVNAPDVIVRCAASTCNVYLVSFATLSTAANARITVYANAERLQ